jgi:uncharacterized protein YqgC (DUF456 family)
MDIALHIFGLILLVVFCIAAAATLVFGLPGTVLLVIIATVYGWATGFAELTGRVLLWLVALAAVGEGFELISATMAVGGQKPSRRVSLSALLGAFAGGIVGTPFLFGVGSLIGALFGAFAGATLASRSEGRTAVSSVHAGMAAMTGRLAGFVVKAAIAVVMIVLIVAAAV